jgi:hypothetical protein
MRVEAERLDRALAARRRRHGSIDRYLEDALTLDAPLRKRLHARLLA